MGVRRDPGKLGKEFDAVHPGHGDVRDDQVEMFRLRFFQTGQSILGHGHDVSERDEDFAQGGKDGRFVVDDEDPRHSPMLDLRVPKNQRDFASWSSFRPQDYPAGGVVDGIYQKLTCSPGAEAGRMDR